MPQIGRYNIIEEVGRGGFATVYRARDTQLNRLVALKVLHSGWSNDPDFVRRFQQEAETIANLRHPNIVVVHDAGEADRQMYIAMEFLTGGDLQKWLADKDGPLTVAEALPILRSVAGALDYAHARGAVHRDIKPSNIMRDGTDESNRVVLTDFGLVKAMENSVALTMTSTTLGSPEYMAPEQADPNRTAEIGTHSDLYAFGIIAYQMLCGRVPFPGQSISTLNAHANLPVPEPQQFNPDLSDDVVAILSRMLAKAPTGRYPTAMAFVDALQATLKTDKLALIQQKQVGSLYAHLRQAEASHNWIQVLTLSAQIEMLLPGYRDVAAFQAEARRQLQAPKPIRDRPSVPEKREAAAPTIAHEKSAETSAPIRKKVEALLQLRKKGLPVYMWVIGGVLSVVLMIWILYLSALNNRPEEPIATSNPVSDVTISKTPSPLPSVIELTETPTKTPTATPTKIPTAAPTKTPTEMPTKTPDPSNLPLDPTRGSTWIRPADEMVMLYAEAGTFMMGSDPDVDSDAAADEQPQHEVTLNGFWIDKTEVTNAQYILCVADDTCRASDYADDSAYNGDKYPVVGVSWDDAHTFCEWAGAQLPTEEQWEYAARGEDGRLYPWGNETPTCDLVQIGGCSGTTMSVGTFSPAGDSWIGASDMAGNVWEWTADWYQPYPENREEDNQYYGAEYKVLRGGSWGSVARRVRSAYRLLSTPSDRYDYIGFRCAAPGK